MGSLTKQTGDIFGPKTLKDRLGGVNTIKKILGVDKTPPALERSLERLQLGLRVNYQQI